MAVNLKERLVKDKAYRVSHLICLKIMPLLCSILPLPHKPYKELYFDSSSQND